MRKGISQRIHPAGRRPAVPAILAFLAGFLGAGFLGAGPLGAGPAWATNGGFLAAGLGAAAASRLVLPVDPRATPQWRRTLKRQADSDSRSCGTAKPKVCAIAGWGKFLKGLSGEPLRAQIKAVNFFVNQVRYREDHEAWGAQDYWATPREFFGHGGDCEDYAIAKYLALRALGIEASKLFILVVKDQLDRSMHAILVVDAPDGALVLDNRTELIVPWRDFLHYEPVYWVNEDSGWITVARR